MNTIKASNNFNSFQEIEMYTMQEVMARERMREAERQAAEFRMIRKSAAARRWRWAERVTGRAHAHAASRVRSYSA